MEDKAFGWGLNFSSGVMVGKRDNLPISATYGEGVSRYYNLYRKPGDPNNH